MVSYLWNSPRVHRLVFLYQTRHTNMYKMKGVDVIATITEVRSKTSELLEQAQKSRRGIMIQRNNDPQAVLISWELYQKIKDRVNLHEL